MRSLRVTDSIGFTSTLVSRITAGEVNHSQTFCPNVSPPLSGLGMVANKGPHRLAAESRNWGMATSPP